MSEKLEKVMMLMLTHQQLQLLALMAAMKDQTGRPFQVRFDQYFALAQTRLADRVGQVIRQQVQLWTEAISAQTAEEFLAAWGKMDVLNQAIREGLDELFRDPPGTAPTAQS